MKREQQSISKQLAAIKHEIEVHNTTFDEIKNKLSLVMEMVEDCGNTYRRANDKIKKYLNQAFFKRVWIEEDGSVTPEFTAVCEGVFETQRILQKSTSENTDADFIDKLFKSSSNFFGQGLNNDILVGAAGFEPATNRL